MSTKGLTRLVAVPDDRPRAQAVDRMRARGLPVPEGYAFDRNDANERPATARGRRYGSEGCAFDRDDINA